MPPETIQSNAFRRADSNQKVIGRALLAMTHSDRSG